MNKVYKTIISVAAAAIVGGATLVPANVLAWGDSAGGRSVYTIEQINNGALGDTITFNSITNGKIGDERNFVGAKLSGTTAVKDNEISVEDGKTYTVRLYVHNNSPLGVEKTAEGVSVSFALPTTVGKTHTVVGYIDSSNATPNRYWDEVKFVSDDNFFIEYVDGSAKYTNTKLGTVSLPNEVITSGAKIGYEALDGKIPGCFAYDGEVTIEVMVHKASTAKLSKTVRLKGTKEWKESVDANIGDEVEYQIEYKNLTSETAENVTIRDILPRNMEYVNDSTYLYNAKYQSGIQVVENTVATTGINIGSYATKGNAYVRFTAKVINNTLACGDNQLVNWANVTINSEVAGKDDASVMVNKVCEEPEPVDPEPVDPEPVTPSRMPSTGPTEIVAGALGTGSMVTMLGYFIASRKK